MQKTIARARALNTPEANLRHRMAHIARVEELVFESTEEGSTGRAELEAHVDNLRLEIRAVYRAEKADQMRARHSYMRTAAVEALPRPVQETPAYAIHEVPVPLLARAWQAVKGVFARA